jgi:Domain of unknown function (DUF4412)
MKKSSIFTILLLFVASVCAPSLQAQFFKQLLDNVKQTAQGRANSKTSQTTNNALDKVDPSAQTKTGTGDSGASKPDTSAAGMMKVLGLLVGGGGVSAADSAAAIKTYQTASGGSGMFYQYITSTTSKKGAPSNDTSSTFLTKSDGRHEMRINMPGVMTGKMIIIGHINQPTYSVSLHPDEKTYSLNVIDTSLINGRTENYQVTRIGNETVQGYSCVHVKMKTTTGSGLFKSTSTMDLWTSTAVPGYGLYKSLMDGRSASTPRMMQALDNAGAGGFMVRMDAGGKDYTMSMVLVHAEEKNLPASLFEIPAGYTDSKQNFMESMLSGAKKTN